MTQVQPDLQGQLVRQAALVQQVLSEQRVLRDLLVRQATPAQWVQLDLQAPQGQLGMLGLQGRQVRLALKVSKVIPVRLARRVQQDLQAQLDQQVRQVPPVQTPPLQDLQVRLGLLVFKVRLDPQVLQDYRETLVPLGRLVLRVQLVQLRR